MGDFLLRLLDYKICNLKKQLVSFRAERRQRHKPMFLKLANKRPVPRSETCFFSYLSRFESKHWIQVFRVFVRSFVSLIFPWLVEPRLVRRHFSDSSFLWSTATMAAVWLVHSLTYIANEWTRGDHVVKERPESRSHRQFKIEKEIVTKKGLLEKKLLSEFSNISCHRRQRHRWLTRLVDVLNQPTTQRHACPCASVCVCSVCVLWTFRDTCTVLDIIFVFCWKKEIKRNNRIYEEEPR